MQPTNINYMTDKEKGEQLDKLVMFLSKWGIDNDYNIITPNDGELEVDFININFNTNKIYFGSLAIDDPLTDVG